MVQMDRRKADSGWKFAGTWFATVSRRGRKNEWIDDDIAMIDAHIGILVVGANPARTAILEVGLREGGYQNLAVLSDIGMLRAMIAQHAPDVVFVDAGSPSLAVLQPVLELARTAARAFAVFADRADAALIDAAVDAGVSSIVVDGLTVERVVPTLHIALSRHRQSERVRRELDRAKQALQERKVIDRAKGILMKERGMDEEGAYGLLRRAAMNENLRLADVAQRVVTAAQLLK